MIFNKKKKYQQLSDKELIELWRNEDCSYTIPILYERYGHLVLGSCLKYLKQLENAEDICMQIFTSLGDKLKKHNIEHFKSWLYQVTRNECLQLLRKNTNYTTIDIELISVSENLDEDDKKSTEKRLTLLEQGISLLKEDQKKCIELFYLHDKSYQEISNSLKLPLNTVKSAIQNGKRNLKIWMEENENKN